MRTALIVLWLISASALWGQETADSSRLERSAPDKNLSFSGQITSWGVTQFADQGLRQLGGRFIPTLLGTRATGSTGVFDFEASLHINGGLNWAGNRFDTATGAIKPYRVWMRYSGENWEVRGGLQKINFGSARIFRPLMWFDRMDVRDPLQLTDGVYGVLGKYFFPNNTNIWLWSLIGNKNPKGFELLGSAPGSPELGGRIETALGPGELAFSAHFRKADLHSLIPAVPMETYINENRFGLDGKWDVGPGVWLESGVSLYEKTGFSFTRFQTLFNTGADYTFPLGSGLNVTAEYFRFHAGDKIWREGISANILGGMITYPLSITDNVSLMLFYLDEPRKWFSYASFTRMYDNWSFFLIGFLNPETDLPFYGLTESRNLFMGKGMQVMVSYSF